MTIPTISAADRLRMQARTGRVLSIGAPMAGDQETGSPTVQVRSEAALAPGEFPPIAPHLVEAAASQAASTELPSKPLPEAVPSKLSAGDRLRSHVEVKSNTTVVRKEMAAMRTLTRLLEAIYARPGSSASDQERMTALSLLSTQAMTLGGVVARVAGEDADRSHYIRAVAMEAAVGLVCKSWENGTEVDWGKLVEISADTPEINEAANAMALAAYRPVNSLVDAADRLTISAHSAFWQVHGLGETVNGVTPKLAAEIVRDCLKYLQERDKFIVDNDMHVTWLQGSIRRLIDLVCAEIRARFKDEPVPTEDDIRSVLAVARSGFEGVENYAQSILEKQSTESEPRPVDR